MAYNVAMFVARILNRKSKSTILLRESYRESGKVRTRTIANLTKWPQKRIAVMKRLVKGKFNDWSGEFTSGFRFSAGAGRILYNADR